MKKNYKSIHGIYTFIIIKMDSYTLLNDIFNYLCSFLNTNEIVKMRLLSKHHKNLIKKLHWYQNVKIKNEEILQTVIH